MTHLQGVVKPVWHRGRGQGWVPDSRAIYWTWTRTAHWSLHSQSQPHVDYKNRVILPKPRLRQGQGAYSCTGHSRPASVLPMPYRFLNILSIRLGPPNTSSHLFLTGILQGKDPYTVFWFLAVGHRRANTVFPPSPPTAPASHGQVQALEQRN